MLKTTNCYKPAIKTSKKIGGSSGGHIVLQRNKQGVHHQQLGLTPRRLTFKHAKVGVGRNRFNQNR